MERTRQRPRSSARTPPRPAARRPPEPTAVQAQRCRGFRGRDIHRGRDMRRETKEGDQGGTSGGPSRREIRRASKEGEQGAGGGGQQLRGWCGASMMHQVVQPFFST